MRLSMKKPRVSLHVWVDYWYVILKDVFEVFSTLVWLTNKILFYCPKEPFQDGPRSIRMMVPSGWNKFDGEVGAYDLKWQDLVDPAENIKISSNPVKSTTTAIDALGEVQAVGESLAAKRNAKLISATERLTDGVLFYKFDFAINDGTHQLLQLCVCKGKVWSIDANAKEKRWDKKAELYENVLGSFMPKLA